MVAFGDVADNVLAPTMLDLVGHNNLTVHNSIGSDTTRFDSGRDVDSILDFTLRTHRRPRATSHHGRSSTLNCSISVNILLVYKFEKYVFSVSIFRQKVNYRPDWGRRIHETISQNLISTLKTRFLMSKVSLLIKKKVNTK